jgi:hypothetical protein
MRTNEQAFKQPRDLCSALLSTVGWGPTSGATLCSFSPSKAPAKPALDQRRSPNQRRRSQGSGARGMAGDADPLKVTHPAPDSAAVRHPETNHRCSAHLTCVITNQRRTEGCTQNWLSPCMFSSREIPYIIVPQSHKRHTQDIYNINLYRRC